MRYYSAYIENIENNIDYENIEKMTYGSSPIGSSAFGSAGSEAPLTCPVSLKYSGDPVTLKSTPKDGIGPYQVVFKKNGITIDPSRLSLTIGGPTGESNPIIDAPEDIQITRVYTLDDADIASALTGTIDFSVYISDSCPTVPQTCDAACTINIGCLAPVCNFVVT